MGQFKDKAHCVDCGAERVVKHREWIRASQPRCYSCGGRVERSAAAAEEHVAHADAKRASDAKADKDRRGKA